MQAKRTEKHGTADCVTLKHDCRVLIFSNFILLGGTGVIYGGFKNYGAAKIVSDPTRVVLLLNMVGRGEDESALETETIEECEKFGPVKCCAIREVSSSS